MVHQFKWGLAKGYVTTAPAHTAYPTDVHQFAWLAECCPPSVTSSPLGASTGPDAVNTVDPYQDQGRGCAGMYRKPRNGSPVVVCRLEINYHQGVAKSKYESPAPV